MASAMITNPTAKELEEMGKCFEIYADDIKKLKEKVNEKSEVLSEWFSFKDAGENVYLETISEMQTLFAHYEEFMRNMAYQMEATARFMEEDEPLGELVQAFK